MNEINIHVIKEAYGKVAYSHKTQEKAKEIDGFFVHLIKWANVVLIGLTTISATRNLFISPERVNISTAVLATISLMFVIAQLSFNPEIKAREHKNCADKLWLIREKYINLLADIMCEKINEQTIKDLRDRLTDELFKIYDEAPPAGGLAYIMARRALKIKKELTFSAKELDQLLPESLRTQQRNK